MINIRGHRFDLRIGLPIVPNITFQGGIRWLSKPRGLGGVIKVKFYLINPGRLEHFVGSLGKGIAALLKIFFAF